MNLVGIFAFRHAHSHGGSSHGHGSHGHSHHGHSHGHGHAHDDHHDRSVNMQGTSHKSNCSRILIDSYLLSIHWRANV